MGLWNWCKVSRGATNTSILIIISWLMVSNTLLMTLISTINSSLGRCPAHPSQATEVGWALQAAVLPSIRWNLRRCIRLRILIIDVVILHLSIRQRTCSLALSSRRAPSSSNIGTWWRLCGANLHASPCRRASSTCEGLCSCAFLHLFFLHRFYISRT